MSKARPSTPSLRIGVPELFRDGRYEQVLISTFGPDLEFYERVLRRHFGNFRNQIVLAHGELLDQQVTALAGSGGLRHLNRSWLAGPVRLRHAAHAKVILLAGPESGLLLVGSGNLNLSGYAGAGECFTSYRWNPDEVGQLAAFTAIRSMTDGMAARGYLDAVTIDRLRAFWSAYDWWHATPVPDGPVRHNLEVPLGSQFVDALQGQAVADLIVATPFHDPACNALDRLISSLRPERVQVLVQPGRCSVDPERLASVAGAHGAKVHAITAAGHLDTTYLHAKIILAKTADGSVCLTGSANCSMVALWTTHPNANVEVGNLAAGARNAFDHLLHPSVVTISGPIDPTELGLEVQPHSADDDHDDEAVRLRLADLRWHRSRLHAQVSPNVHDADRVSVIIDGRTVDAVISLQQEATHTTLVIELADAADAQAIESVAVVCITVDGVGSATAVPYQVERLREQDRRRVDADRLRHAAQLELDDPDLEQALAALEEILVGDNVARWSRQTSEAPADPESAVSIAWGDIDWSSVRRHPRFAAYGSLTGFGQPGSGLADYLEALSRVVRELLDPEGPPTHPAPSSNAVPDDDDEDAGDEVAVGIEGTSLDDDPEADDDAEGASANRRQSPAARNRRLIRNFVRRNLNALEHPDFRAGVGPGIVIPNAIILNWLCWWVATKDPDGPERELVDERIRLWRMLWGEVDGGTGYLDELDDEHRLLVLERFDNQRFAAVLAASFCDVWESIPESSDPAYRQLRGVLRRAVTHPCWQIGASHLADAATLTNLRPSTLELTTALDLADRLWEITCSPIDERDDRFAVATTLGTDINNISLSSVSVVVDGKADQRTVRQMQVTMGLGEGQAVQVLAAWVGMRNHDFYRLVWPGGVGFYNLERDIGFVVSGDGSETSLDGLEPMYPPWRLVVDRLWDAVDSLAQDAHSAA